MKRLKILFILCLVVLLLPVSAYAAEDVGVVQTLVQDDTLYLWLDTSALKEPVTQVNATINGELLSPADVLQTVAQVEGGSYCIFLLDRSGSMPKYKQEILEFMDAYTSTCPDDSKYALATFGDAFELTADNLDGADLSAALDQVTYNTQNTRLYEGTAEALDHLAKRQRRGGEIHSIVLLTDGVEDAPSSAVTYEELLEVVEEAGVLLHAVGFGDDAEALKNLAEIAAAGGGRCGVPGTEFTPSALAEQMTTKMNRLRMATYDLSDYTGPKGPQSVELTLAAGAQLLGKTEAVANLSGGTGSGMETQTLLPEKHANEKKPPVADDEKEPEVIPPTAEMPPASSTEQTVPAEPKQKEASGMNMMVIAALVTVLIGIVLIVAFKKCKKNGKNDALAEGPVVLANDPEQGIYMRLEIEQGNYIGSKTEFGLTEELLVGLGGHIVFADLPSRSARVFVTEGIVYVAPLGGELEVCVNDLPIAMPNILRSGDKISVGEVAFRLKF